MKHSHKPKVLEWVLNEDFNWVSSLYGCLDCDETFASTPLDEEEDLGHQHTTYVEGCFGCKAKTLQLSPGDAHSGRQVSEKKWDAENQAFADAERQGIQPDGVFQKDIQEAHRASEVLGTAYNADTMLPAHQITKGVAEVYKEIGVI